MAKGKTKRGSDYSLKLKTAEPKIDIMTGKAVCPKGMILDKDGKCYGKFELRKKRKRKKK